MSLLSFSARGTYVDGVGVASAVGSNVTDTERRGVAEANIIFFHLKSV